MLIGQTQLVFLAAYARLQELEMKRYGVEDEGAENKGKFRPLSGEEAAEYEGLKKWWYDIGMDNQVRLREFARACGRQISNAATVEAAAKSALILPSRYSEFGS